MRLGNVSPRRVIGENRALVMIQLSPCGSAAAAGVVSGCAMDDAQDFGFFFFVPVFCGMPSTPLTPPATPPTTAPPAPPTTPPTGPAALLPAAEPSRAPCTTPWACAAQGAKAASVAATMRTRMVMSNLPMWLFFAQQA